MKPWKNWAKMCCGSVVIALVSGVALAQDAPAKPKVVSAQAAKTSTLIFVPPAIGAPGSRVGAGTRGSETDSTLIVLLVPPKGGLTTLEKPPLVWRLTADFSGAFHVSFKDLAPDGRGVTHTTRGRFRAGFHALDLARSEMLLELGHIYHWSVSAVDLGSNNVVASASSYVERVEALTLHPVDPMERPKGASELGLWFDALAPLFQLTLSGQAQLIEASLFSQLASSANLPTAAAE